MKYCRLSSFSASTNSNSFASARLILPGEIPPVGVDPFAEFPQALEVHPAFQSLTLCDFDFFQGGQKLACVDNKVSIDGGKDLTVSIDYEKLPEVLKTIGLTLRDPLDPARTFSFLLRVEQDKTAYLATLSPLLDGGVYELNVTILDHQNQGLKKLRGDLLVAQAIAALPFSFVVGFLKSTAFLNLLLFLFILLLLGLLARDYYRGWKEKYRRGEPSPQPQRIS